MNYSEYKEITWGLEFLMNSRDFGIETMRVLFATVEVPADPVTLLPGERATKRVPADIAKEHYLFNDRLLIFSSVAKVVERTAELMDRCVGKWVDTNQDRADHKMHPTIHTMSLIPLMSNFLTATSTPIPGYAGMYDKVRRCCREWVRSANKLFPEILANQGDETKTAPQESEPASITKRGRGRVVTVNLNREKLEGCFNNDFREKKNNAPSRFDRFYYALTTARFCTMDWGRIAYAIKFANSINSPRVRALDFSKWMVEFFDCIGVEPPSDKRQTHYEKQGGTREFILQWLNTR